MGFGRNPYVAKAEAAELKADSAPDDSSRMRAHRDAAHEWDRAAEREKPGKQRTAYEQSAARNRQFAEASGPEGAGEPSEGAEDSTQGGPVQRTTPSDPKSLN